LGRRSQADSAELGKSEDESTRNRSLLHLDADGRPRKGKGIYVDILKAGYAKMPPGSLVLAHNSVNAAQRLLHYLEFVRDPAHFRASVDVIFDPEGLEVSVK
jgi:hypothetical protein